MLETIGYDAAVAASYAPWDAADASVGRVVRVDRGVAAVLTEQGPERVTIGGALLNQMAHDPAAGPCVGDWVVVRAWPGHRLTVEHVLPRRTTLACTPYGGRRHVLAANCDVAAAVVAAPRGRTARDLPGLLEAVRDSGAAPAAVLVLTRATTDVRPLVDEVGAVAPGAELVLVTPATGAGVDRLRGLVAGGRTLALLAADTTTGDTLVRALVGAQTLHGAGGGGGGLVVLPAGGAVMDLRLPPADPVGGWTTHESKGKTP